MQKPQNHGGIGISASLNSYFKPTTQQLK